MKNVLLHLSSGWSVMDRRRQLYRGTAVEGRWRLPIRYLLRGKRESAFRDNTHIHTKATFIQQPWSVCVLPSIHSGRVVVAWREQHLSATKVIGGQGKNTDLKKRF